MDGPTRAVLLGAFITILAAMIGWLLKRAIGALDNSIVALSAAIERLGGEATRSLRATNSRLERLERWRVKCEAVERIKQEGGGA